MCGPNRIHHNFLEILHAKEMQYECYDSILIIVILNLFKFSHIVKIKIILIPIEYATRNLKYTEKPIYFFYFEARQCLNQKMIIEFLLINKFNIAKFSSCMFSEDFHTVISQVCVIER